MGVRASAVIAGGLALMAPALAAAKGPVPLTAPLTGAVETPKGDPDGQGAAGIVLKAGKVCYGLVASDIGAPIAAHIHKGRPGVAGPIVLDLAPKFSPGPFFAAAGCVKASASVIAGIRRNPAGYYVNIHTKAFPGGAIRGQLGG
jgi:hypothetical protein